MADYIRREPYRIGYLSPAGAVEVNLRYVWIVNRRGRITVGDKRAVQSAMDDRALNMSSRLTASIIDCTVLYETYHHHAGTEHSTITTGPSVTIILGSSLLSLHHHHNNTVSIIDCAADDAYPIAGFTYFVVRMKQTASNCTMATELARYIEWFLTSPQAEAEVDNKLMVPISQNIAARIRGSVLERMTCNGQSLMGLVRRQKYDEQESLKTWKLPVQIVTPLIGVSMLLLAAYAIRQRAKYLRMWDRDDYNIDFVVPKEYCQNGEAENQSSPRSMYNCLDQDDIHKVVTRPLSFASIFGVDRKVKQALMRMRDEISHENEIWHENVARFFGISSRDDGVHNVEQCCANGTLVNFLRDNEHVVNQWNRALKKS